MLLLHPGASCGTYTTIHGEKRQMYRCLVCGKRFSETAETPFFGLKTLMRTVGVALNELAEGLGVRAVACIHYATVHREREGGRVVLVTTQVVYGSLKEVLACLKPLKQTINTSFVERMNLTLRHLLSRLHRRSLWFSKRREYLACHLHLALAYYHFVRYHSSLRVRLSHPIPTRGNGSPKKWEQRTPAMAAGLTDHAWSLEELLMCHMPAAAG